MKEMGMSEEDYVRLLNLAIRLKTDSANNNQGDQDQGLQEREGEDGSSGLAPSVRTAVLEEKEDSPPTQNSTAAASTPRGQYIQAVRTNQSARRSNQSARSLNFE